RRPPGRGDPLLRGAPLAGRDRAVPAAGPGPGPPDADEHLPRQMAAVPGRARARRGHPASGRPMPAGAPGAIFGGQFPRTGQGEPMTTKLYKPLKREVQIGDKAYTLTIDPTGLKLVEQGQAAEHTSALQSR